VHEWNENVAFGGGRISRGVGWVGLTTPLKASSAGSFIPTSEGVDRGFRLALLSGSGGNSLDITKVGVVKFVERFDGTASGDYVFDVIGASAADSKMLDFQATEPGGYLDIMNPFDGALVPDDQDLDFTWALVEESSGAGCVGGMSCADELSAEIFEFTPMDVIAIVDDRFPITTTGVLIPASDLNEGSVYDALIATSNGTSNPSDVTDMGDPIVTSTAYEDINLMFFEAVPEPAAELLGISALLTLGAIRRGCWGKL